MKWYIPLGVLGITIMGIGHGIGLFATPGEAAMGETARILYVHVPTAWTALCAFLAAGAAAVGVLWSGKARWDALMEATVEVGVVFCGLLLIQGSIWAYPTWNTWWTWDPRLTTSAVLMVAFVGVLTLRKLIHQAERRMTISAVATIVSAVDVPIVYFSVKWWGTIHQGFSARDTVDTVMLVPLMVSLLGTSLFGIALIAARYAMAFESRRREDDAPDLPDVPAPLDLEERP